MARVIQAITMKPTMANPCLVAGASGSGANHTAGGRTTQRICPAMTSGEFGSSSRASGALGALSVCAVVIGCSRG